jgi:glycosyltransferase involved in cell wall biosynthesis
VQAKPTIVHSSTSKAGPLAMMAAFVARVPIRIYCLRGVMIDRRQGPSKAILKIVEWLGCACAHRVLAVSPSVADVTAREGLCPVEKMRVLGNGSSNGVDARNRFNPASIEKRAEAKLRRRLDIPDDAKIVGYIGRIVAGKGLADLGEAWMTIKNLRDDAWLLVIGPREAQDPLPKRLVEELESDHRVRLLEFVPNADLPVYYKTINVIAFPTDSEGFPNVPLEAAAMEVPVVATRVTGCVDAIVDDVTGKLVPQGDPDAMAQALLAYLDSEELISKHGQAGRRRALRDYDPTSIWEAVYQEYVRLLKAKGLAPPVPSPLPDHPDSNSVRSRV